MSDSFCPAPWNGLHIWQDGGISPCCEIPPSIHGSIAEYLSGDFLNRLRDDMLSGRRPTSCANCWTKESAGGHSSRLIELDIYGSDPHVLRPGQRVNLYLSNKCNMSCRMCNEDVSTGWIKDAHDPEIEEINRLLRGHVYHPGYQHGWHHMDELIDMISASEGEVNIRLRGGETLYIDENIHLLDQLLSREQGHKIRLGIITNGSIAQGDILDMLDSFRSVSIGVSIDGTEHVHGYIRGPSVSFREICENATKLWSIGNVDTRWISMAVNPLNLLDLGASAAMIKDRWPNVWIWHNRVVEPLIMDAMLMPNDLKDLAVDRLHHRPDILSSLAPCFIHSDDGDHHLARHLFARHTKRLDQLRGQDIGMVVPELSPYIERWVGKTGYP